MDKKLLLNMINNKLEVLYKKEYDLKMIKWTCAAAVLFAVIVTSGDLNLVRIGSDFISTGKLIFDSTGLILASIGTYVSSKQHSKVKKQIEKYEKQGNELADEINQGKFCSDLKKLHQKFKMMKATYEPAKKNNVVQIEELKKRREELLQEKNEQNTTLPPTADGGKVLQFKPKDK